MNFNWEIYKELNPDLVLAGLNTKEQIEHHYQQNGKFEHRKVSILDLYPDFSIIQYRKNYKDLIMLTDVQLVIHWLRYGISEKRTYLDKSLKEIKEIKEVKNEKRLKESFDDLSSVPYINKKNYILSKEYSVKKENIYKLKEKYIKILKEIMEQNIQKRNVLLTLADSIYPPFGGGENWLLDMNKIVENDFFCVAVCFKDVFNNKVFSEIEYVKHQNVHIIQIPIVVRDIIAIIDYIKPVCISHQGHNRLLYCMIAKLMKINFLTGFCFWNDLIMIENNFFNINMTSRKFKKDQNLDIIFKNSNIYLASEFMKNIVQKNINVIGRDIDLSAVNLDVIPTISYHNHYINNKVLNSDNRKFVCILNSHFLKGGQELIYLLQNLDYTIPILAVITERDMNEQIIIDLFRERNEHSNINVLYTSKIEKINEIYNKCKVLLIPSIVDETFCRVAYEGMQLGLPIISYKTGNLGYLLKNYNNNTFIDMPLKQKEIKTTSDTIIDTKTLSKWVHETQNIYKNCKLERHNMYNITEKEIRTSLLSKINKKIEYSSEGTIGFFCPFVDQGLGIQCREYITYLNQNGYKTAVLSFKPYLAVQVDKTEWKYANIHYSKNSREEIILEEVIDFVFKYNVKTIMIPEICYKQIYQKIDFFKCLGVKVVGIINIELLRYTELEYYHYFDLILANNESSYNILKDILPYSNVQLLEFNNYYMKKSLSIRNNGLNKPTETIRIATFGGLNSYVRKNIDKTYLVFKKLEMQYKMTKNYNFKLNVYIQGVDKAVQSNIILKDTENISIHFNNYSYSEIIGLINDNDIVIHLGDHEGLGLGFFEALNNNKTLITLNTYPNSEYIIDGLNGYLIDCKFQELTDNNQGITNRAIVNLDHYYKLMERILENSYRPTLYKLVMANKNIVNNYEKNFVRVLKNI